MARFKSLGHVGPHVLSLASQKSFAAEAIEFFHGFPRKSGKYPFVPPIKKKEMNAYEKGLKFV
jgi:hypothetical protein